MAVMNSNQLLNHLSTRNNMDTRGSKRINLECTNKGLPFSKVRISRCRSKLAMDSQLLKWVSTICKPEKTRMQTTMFSSVRRSRTKLVNRFPRGAGL